MLFLVSLVPVMEGKQLSWRRRQINSEGSPPLLGFCFCAAESEIGALTSVSSLERRMWFMVMYVSLLRWHPLVSSL